jgi:hypothetical protein
VKNSLELLHTISSVCAGPQDILVGFHVALLLTKVPIEETLCPLSRHFDEDTLKLFPFSVSMANSMNKLIV